MHAGFAMSFDHPTRHDGSLDGRRAGKVLIAAADGLALPGIWANLRATRNRKASAMMNLLHTALEIVILVMLFMMLLKLENMHRTIDRMAGPIPDGEQAAEETPESA
jgi:hypothetical protein